MCEGTSSKFKLRAMGNHWNHFSQAVEGRAESGNAKQERVGREVPGTRDLRKEAKQQSRKMWSKSRLERRQWECILKFWGRGGDGFEINTSCVSGVFSVNED